MKKKLSRALDYINENGGIYKIVDKLNNLTMKENDMRKAYDTNRGHKMTKQEGRELIIKILNIINPGIIKTDLNTMTDEQLLGIVKNDMSYIKQIVGSKDA